MRGVLSVSNHAATNARKRKKDAEGLLKSLGNTQKAEAPA
jgi:hypothetical protein